MMGPLYSIRDEPHLERMLTGIREAGISVIPDERCERAFWFRRGYGLVWGGVWENLSGLYLGFGHPFNPLLWPADGSLLHDVERELRMCGSRWIVPTPAREQTD